MDRTCNLNQTFASLGLTPGQYVYAGRSETVSVNTGDETGAVPEPATWAMMPIGFGLIGDAIRRRQRRWVAYS